MNVLSDYPLRYEDVSGALLNKHTKHKRTSSNLKRRGKNNLNRRK